MGEGKPRLLDLFAGAGGAEELRAALDEERFRLRKEERGAASLGKRSQALVFEREANGIERAAEILAALSNSKGDAK